MQNGFPRRSSVRSPTNCETRTRSSSSSEIGYTTPRIGTVSYTRPEHVVPSIHDLIFRANIFLTQVSVSLGFRVPSTCGRERWTSSSGLKVPRVRLSMSRCLCSQIVLTLSTTIAVTEQATVYFTSIRPTENSEFQIGASRQYARIDRSCAHSVSTTFQYDTRSSLTMAR